MPDTASSVFVWYHADATMEPLLLDWLSEIHRLIGISGRLYVRHTDKTTFMEVYESVESGALARIETLAARQPWIDRLQSPRRAECFNKVDTHG